MAALTEDLAARLRAIVAAATAAGEPEPTAISLATHAERGGLSLRMVLLKGIDARGPRFFTNYHGRKGRQLAANPEVALCMHFKQLDEGVQLRFEGRATRIPPAESDAYFASRPRLSQIGAWASLQSEPLPDRAEFEARIARYEREFAARPVPRPPHWGGYVVDCRLVEFWHARANRLHERECWRATAAGWQATLLYP